jgi:antitoxin (DNA-binding transcriptional repressor) of toxin-antitoxin stability system
MRKVGVKVLKNTLSEQLRAVAGGETVLVTDRGRVVAELGPPRTAAPITPDERWRALIDQGVVTPPRPTDEPWPPAPVASMPLEDLLADLATDRADR